jgi:hypothetical protein
MALILNVSQKDVIPGPGKEYAVHKRGIVLSLDYAGSKVYSNLLHLCTGVV